MSKALELAKFGRETPPTGVVVGDSDAQTLSSKTFSDGPVFSGLNANGVPFLNASKVLGSSSTFVFDGTNLGIGVASPGVKVDVQGSGAGITVARFSSNDTNTTTSLAVFQRNGGAVSAAVKYNATNSPLTIDFGTTTNHALTFITADTERLRIGAGGVIQKPGTNGGLQLMDGNTAGGVKIGAYTANFLANGYLAFEGYSYEYGRFDSTGNFSVGTQSSDYRLTIARGNESTGQVGLANFRTEATGSSTYNAGVQIFGTASATAANRLVSFVMDADGADAAGGNYFYITKAGGDGRVDLIQASNAAMGFAANYAGRGVIDMTLSAAGNLGLGTTPTTGAKFQVTGYTDFWNTTNTLLRVQHDGSRGRLQAYTSGGVGNIALNPDGGNVGVGTDNPAFKLDVNARMRIGDGTNNLVVGYWDSVSNRIESSGKPLFLTSYTDSIRFGMSGSENMRLDSSGALYLYQQGAAAYGALNLVNPDAFIRLNSTGGTADKMKWDIRAISSTGSEALEFRTINDANNVFSTKLWLAHGGNVGIGTTNPGARLSLIAETGGQSMLQVRNYGTAATGGFTNSYTAEIRGASSGDQMHGMRIHLNESGYTTDRRTLDVSDYNGIFASFTNGKVGIGTTDPQAKLTVKGQTHTAPWLAVERSGSGTLQFKIVNAETTGYTASTGTVSPSWTNVIDSNNSNLMLSTLSGGGTGGKIILDGNVGIGTTNPSWKLEVVSAAGLDSPLTIRRDDWQAGEVRLNLALKYAISGYISSGISEYVTDTGYIALNYKSGASTYAEGLRVSNLGRVGINTPSPSGILHVHQDSGGPNTITMSTTFGSGNSYAVNPFIQGVSNGGFSIRDVTNGVDRIAIAYSSGNVGIGTSYPNYKLHVNGTSSFEDTVRQKRFTTHVWENLNGGAYPGYGVSNTARYEIARIAIDYNDWNSVGQTIIELNQIYYSIGGYSKWAVNYGYVQNSKITLLESNGDWQGGTVSIGSPIQHSGDHYYIPVYINVYGYHQFVARLTTTVVQAGDNTIPGPGYISLQKSPTITNLGTVTAPIPDYSTTDYNHLVEGRLATSYYAHNWLFGNNKFVQIRGGKQNGSGTYSLFTRGNSTAQSSGKVYVQAIYGTPATSASWEYVISGDKNISLINSNTSIFAGNTPSIYWSGDTLYASNGNSSTYYTVIVELHNIGQEWDASFGNFPGFLS